MGYGHGAAAEKVNRQDAGYDARDEEHRENQAEVRYRQVTHGALTSAKSGRKGRNVDKAEGAEGQRRRRVPLPPFPAGEQTFRVVHACDCTLRDGKRGYRRTGNPFIKALQACQTNAALKRRGIPRLQVATYRWIRKPGLPRPPCPRPLAGVRISGSGSGM